MLALVLRKTTMRSNTSSGVSTFRRNFCRQNRLIRFCFSLLALAFAPMSLAQSLYVVEVEIGDQGPTARSDAYRLGFKELLTRITGVSAVEKIETLSSALNDPAPFLNRYSYKNQTGPASELSLIVLEFNEERVMGLLAGHRIPIWPLARPKVLVWLAFDDGRQRFVVGVPGTENLKADLEKAARKRGVPAVIPAMDAEDQKRVHFSDIWGGFVDAVRRGSERYDAEVILIGRLSPSPKGWRAHWTLVLNGREHAWNFEGEDRAWGLAIGINGAAEHLAKGSMRTAVASVPNTPHKPNGSNTDTTNSPNPSNSTDLQASRPPLALPRDASGLYLKISNINSVKDYASVSKQIQGLAAVNNATVIQVSGDTLVFSVALKPNAGGLEDVLASEKHLTRQWAQDGKDPASKSPPIYRYSP